MPLYELVCIAKHHTSLTPLQTLIRSSSALIAENGGVVRHLDHWGTRNLPQRMKVGKRRGGGGGSGEDGSSSTGDYFTLRFDCNPPTLSALTTRLRLDPSVLRYTTLKLGSTLDAVAQDPRARGGNRTVRFAREAPPEPVLQGAEAALGARGGMPGQFEGATLDDAREVMRQQQQSAAGGATAPLRRRSFQEL
ncbi:hypothetical protein JCM8202_003579 [Rhodotorula sphaerocarpa]